LVDGLGLTQDLGHYLVGGLELAKFDEGGRPSHVKRSGCAPEESSDSRSGAGVAISVLEFVDLIFIDLVVDIRSVVAL
jgi:hypothetical protein